MKKILILILLYSSLGFSQTQKPKYYGSGGFGFQFPNTDELSLIINQYNNTTENLSKKMNEFGMLFGPNILVGMNLDNDKNFLNFEFGLSILFNSKSSEIKQANGVSTNRDLQIRFPLINLSGQYFIRTDNNMFDFGAGCSVNIGSLKLYGRKYNSGGNKPDYTKITDNNFFSNIGLTPTCYVNLHLSKKIILSLRPGYYFMLGGEDLTSSNDFLNPDYTLQGIDNAKFSGPVINLNLLVNFQK